jgi:hypothetical protein
MDNVEADTALPEVIWQIYFVDVKNLVFVKIILRKLFSERDVSLCLFVLGYF